MYGREHAEAVSFAGGGGTQIAGWFMSGAPRIAPAPPSAAVVVSHGFGGSHEEMVPVASALVEAGFSVLVYDLRGCGRSGGRATYGAREVEDLSAAVDVLAARPDVDPERIGALGFSMGAATTVMTAARDRRIKAVASDSGWADVFHWLRPSRLGRWKLRLEELRAGISLDSLRPERVVAQLAPRPLLLVHGTADDVVPCSDATSLFAAARDPKELWLLDGVTHGETITLAAPGYAARMQQFFTAAL